MRPSRSLVLWEGALARSLQRRAVTAGAQWDADATQDLPGLPVLEAGGVVLAAEGQGGTESPEGPGLPLAPRLGWQQSPGQSVPLAEVARSWGCSSVGTFTGVPAKPRRQRLPLAGTGKVDEEGGS